MWLPDGASLESLGVTGGCAFNVTGVHAAYWLRLPWSEIACVRLTVNEQVELATEGLVLLRVLHWGKDAQRQPAAHIHPIALALALGQEGAA